MQIDADATEDQMIAAFVQADAGSHRDHGRMYSLILAHNGIPQALIEAPDLEDAQGNIVRRELLRMVRGYPDQFLFAGFPRGVRWHLVTLTRNEVGDLFYLARQDYWGPLSRGTRLVRVGAETLLAEGDGPEHGDVRAVAERVRAGDVFPPLICLARSTDGPFMLVEGHTRATAYVMAGMDGPVEVSAYTGVSPGAANWPWYGDIAAAAGG